MPGTETQTVEEIALAAARLLQGLDPGGLAELRRMSSSGAGAPAYWRLAARYPRTIGRRHETWMAIVRTLAILTPKGDPEARPPLHDPKRRLGDVLCDGGDPDWPGQNAFRPAISERRLAQLMSARAQQRPVLLERAVRALAGTRRAGTGINVVDIAWWLLSNDPADAARRLAERYYARLDRAERNQQSTEQGAT